jgi:exopolysaccharide production protein ExoY
VNRGRGPRARGHTAIREVKDHAVRHDSASSGRVRVSESPAHAVLRRLFDVTAAAVLLTLSLPLLALSCVVILIADGRPVFFSQWRVGRHGRPFRCWKLRTMHVGAEDALTQSHALKSRYVANGYKLSLVEDPRVTSAGRLLRRTYLDELPQLFNVLTGSMSIVGPRPVITEQFHAWGPAAAELVTIKPGIVGAWTALGPDRPIDDARVQLELDYVRHRSVWRDAAILLRSLPVILRGHPEDA